MGIFDIFPWSNFHEINLDWIIRRVKELGAAWDDLSKTLDPKIVSAVNQWFAEHPEQANALQIANEALDKVDALTVDIRFSDEYGVPNDGTRDATPQLNTLFSTNDKPTMIVIKSGVYRIIDNFRVYSNTFVWCYPDAVIKCDQRNRVAGHPAAAMFGEYGNNSFATGYGGVHDVYWLGGTFDHGGDAGLTGGGYGGVSVALGHCKNITFDNVTFTHQFNDHSIELNGSQYVTLDRCTFTDGYYTGDANYEAVNIDYMGDGGFPHFGGYDNTPVEDCVIKDCVFSNVQVGVGSHGAPTEKWYKNISVVNCDFSGCTRQSLNFICVDGVDIRNCNFSDEHVLTDPTVQVGSCDNVLLDGCVFRDCQGFQANALSNGRQCKNVTVTNCMFNNVALNVAAVYFRDVNGGSASGNIINGCSENAFSVNFNSSSVCITGNRFKTTDDETEHAFIYTEGCSDVVCTNNVMDTKHPVDRVFNGEFTNCYLTVPTGAEYNIVTNSTISNGTAINGRLVLTDLLPPADNVVFKIPPTKLNNMVLTFGGASASKVVTLVPFLNQYTFRANEDAYILPNEVGGTVTITETGIRVTGSTESLRGVVTYL